MRGWRYATNRVGSMFTWFFTAGPVMDWESASKSERERSDDFSGDAGYWSDRRVAVRGGFPGAAHTEQDVQQTIVAAKQAFAAVKDEVSRNVRWSGRQFCQTNLCQPLSIK